MFLIIHINGKVFGYLGKFTYLSSILFFLWSPKLSILKILKKKMGEKQKKTPAIRTAIYFPKIMQNNKKK